MDIPLQERWPGRRPGPRTGTGTAPSRCREWRRRARIPRVKRRRRSRGDNTRSVAGGSGRWPLASRASRAKRARLPRVPCRAGKDGPAARPRPPWGSRPRLRCCKKAGEAGRKTHANEALGGRAKAAAAEKAAQPAKGMAQWRIETHGVKERPGGEFHQPAAKVHGTKDGQPAAVKDQPRHG